MGGADRDLVNLANALGPNEVRISWVGVDHTDCLKPYLDPRVVARIIDLKFPLFTYLAHENAAKNRSLWLWSKIVAEQMFSLRRPVRELRRILADDPVDIVVSATSVVMLGARYAQACGLPHVWCVKEYLDPRRSACRRFAAVISRLSSAVVVPSSTVAEPFDSVVNILADGSDVSGIRASGNARSRSDVLRSLGLPENELVVAQVGTLQSWKGQHVTAEAFIRLAESQCVPRFSLMFLGGGNSEYKRQLDQILARAPKDWFDAVRFIDFQPDDFSCIAASDVVVHPSTLPDPYPNAVREAMILGKAVIASRAGGSLEMIAEGRTGLFIEPGSSGDLAKTLEALLAAPDKRNDLGRAAYEFATSHFDVHIRKQPFMSLLDQLAHKGMQERSRKATISTRAITARG